MDAIDQLELDVLAHTGNPEAAEMAGETARQCVQMALESCAYILGIPLEALDIDRIARGMLGY